MKTENSVIQDTDGSICVYFDKSTYSLTALKKAAYKFTDRASVLICNQDNQPEASTVEVRFSFSSEKTGDFKQKAIHDFCNEVLDQDLRETIAAETEATRNLILAQAFSQTSLLE
jgi:His-Xaa-Ser system protein HxsD